MRREGPGVPRGGRTRAAVARAALPGLLAVCLSCGGQDSLTGTNPPPEAAPKEAAKKAPKPAAAGAVVQAGLDVLETENPPRLKGKKVGLVANAASMTTDLRWAGDVLLKQGVLVVRLFTPEHGLLARAAAGAEIADSKHERTGLPIVSLYGKKKKPAPSDLEGLDALVFDLQDAGVRFFTYMSTLILCLDAAGVAGIELVVLDRPNPLGGERVEGPVSEGPGAMPASFVNTAPGPLLHGLTTGEMARFVNASRPKPAKLTVVAMKGWSRAMTWADTGRTWVAPSPNLRDPEAAMAYPGTALLEATNVSEGRGTDAPFLLLGAPWVKAPELAAATAPGFTLEATTFTPQASDAAADPKHKGVECSGVRVKLADPKAARPYTLGVALLRALRGQAGFEWRDDGAALDRLVGTRRLREALERGDAADAIVQADAGAIEVFKTQRKAALLY